MFDVLINIGLHIFDFFMFIYSILGLVIITVGYIIAVCITGFVYYDKYYISWKRCMNKFIDDIIDFQYGIELKSISIKRR